MNRIIISLDKKDKDWLSDMAEDQQVSMAEVIRRAIGQYREAQENNEHSRQFKKRLTQTKGTWSEGDSIEYINKLRNEWDD